MHPLTTGHSGWVTAVAVCRDPTDTSKDMQRNLLLTGGRDNVVLVWRTINNNRDISRPYRALRGHNGYINDIAVNQEGTYAVSAADDLTPRVWDLKTLRLAYLLKGHQKDVLCVSFVDQERIVSGSRDRSIRVWNVTGECVFVFEGAHDNWVTSIKAFVGEIPICVTGSQDKRFKVFNLRDFKLAQSHVGDDGSVSTVAISQDGSICASAGKMGKIHLWYLAERRHCIDIDAGDIVNGLCFSPERYWLCAVTREHVKVWDISQNKALLHEKIQIQSGTEKYMTAQPLCVTWSDDGNTLFVGYSDETVRVWSVHA